MIIRKVEILVDDPLARKVLVTYTERRWLFFRREVTRVAFTVGSSSWWCWLDDGSAAPNQVEYMVLAARTAKLFDLIEQNHPAPA